MRNAVQCAQSMTHGAYAGLAVRCLPVAAACWNCNSAGCSTWLTHDVP